MPDTNDAQAGWEQATEGRDRSLGAIRVIELEAPVAYPPYLMPGTILVVAGASADPVLAAVPDLVGSADWRELSLRLFDAEDDLLAHASEVPSLADVAVLGELRYGSKTLLRGIGAPGRGAHATLLMFVGGDLDENHLRLDAFTSHEDYGLGAVLVANPPDLTSVEREIVNQVSEQPEEMFLAEPAFWPAVAKEGAKFIATYLTGKAVDRIVEAERQAAQRRERYERLAERVGRENARNRYRNMQMAPDETLLRQLGVTGGEIESARSTQELLEVRRQILRRVLEEQARE